MSERLATTIAATADASGLLRPDESAIALPNGRTSAVAITRRWGREVRTVAVLTTPEQWTAFADRRRSAQRGERGCHHGA